MPGQSGQIIALAFRARAILAAREGAAGPEGQYLEDAVMSDPLVKSTLTGLTELEARAFHRLFVMSFLVFVVVAIVAHVLAWVWRPWLPGAGGYQTSLLDHAHALMPHAMTFLT